MLLDHDMFYKLATWDDDVYDTILSVINQPKPTILNYISRWTVTAAEKKKREEAGKKYGHFSGWLQFKEQQKLAAAKAREELANVRNWYMGEIGENVTPMEQIGWNVIPFLVLPRDSLNNECVRIGEHVASSPRSGILPFAFAKGPHYQPELTKVKAMFEAGFSLEERMIDRIVLNDVTTSVFDFMPIS